MGSFRAVHSFRLHLCLLAMLTAPFATAEGQELARAAEAQAPAHISVVDGVAILERDGDSDNSPGSMPLLAGDRVRTRAGRVEILFADGSTLHLDHNSVVDLQSDELVRLIEGRIRLSIPGPARDVHYRVDGPHGWAVIGEPGDYRLALQNGPRGSELELAVLRGRAELANDDGRTALRAGERAFARGGAAPSYAYVANSAAFDAFDRWSEARRNDRIGASAEYLPDEVRPYSASFERHGYWRDEPTYGRVWYPRVEPDWRPYYRGRWVMLRPYGWTWVAHDPWGWPTHHYGRWGHSSVGWFWIPGRTWGAAWVSWAYGGDYVSWCPLGWNNRPVFQINVNIGSRGYDPWRGWTAVSRRHFGGGFVHRNVVRFDRIDDRSRPSFTSRDRAPEVGGYAVPRGSSPIRTAGTRDNRRSASPLFTNVPADRSRVTTGGQRVRVPEPRDSSADHNVGSRAVTRGERMIPDRPATRSERSTDRGGDSGYRRNPAAAARPDSPAQNTERPRAIGAEPTRGTRAYERPRVDDEAARTERPRTNPPAYARPSEIQRRPPSNDSPAYAPRERRAVPRDEVSRPPAEYNRPSGESRRAPQPEPRGPDRPSAGSYERRAPAASQPPRADQPSRPSGGVSPGARPRPSGGTSSGSSGSGTAVRRPGGG